MKVNILKIVRKVLFLLSVLLLGICLLLDGTTTTSLTTSSSSTANPAFSEIVILSGISVTIYLITLFLGAVINFSKNELASRIGFAMVGCSALEALIGFFNVCAAVNLASDSSSSKTVSIGIGSILALVGVILFCCAVVLYLFEMFVSGMDNTKSTDARIMEVKKWKELLNEEIITREEFEAKRTEVLKLNQKDKEKK